MKPMPDDVRNSVEVRLYEAYRKGNGIRLSADDVDILLDDDAILTRISNKLSSNKWCANGVGSGTQTPRQLWKLFHQDDIPRKDGTK